MYKLLKFFPALPAQLINAGARVIIPPDRVRTVNGFWQFY
jgi:hypothetical protein